MQLLPISQRLLYAMHVVGLYSVTIGFHLGVLMLLSKLIPGASQGPY